MKTRKEIFEAKRRRQQAKMLKVPAVLATLAGVSLVGVGSIEASDWVANTPQSIVIEDGAVEYAMKWGDTIWAIGQRINVKTDVLLEVNGLTYEGARVIPVGRVIKLVGSVDGAVSLEVKEQSGAVVGVRELTDEDKVDKGIEFGRDVETGEKTLVVTTGVSEGATTVKPSEPVEEPVKPSEPVETPVQPSEPVEEPVKPSEPVEEPVKPSEPVEEPVKPSEPVEEPVKPSEPVEEPVKPSEPVEEPVKPSEPVEEPVKPSEPVEEPVKPSEPTKPVPDNATKPVYTTRANGGEGATQGIVSKEYLASTGVKFGTFSGDYSRDGDLGYYATKAEATAQGDYTLDSDVNTDSFVKYLTSGEGEFVKGYFGSINEDGSYRINFYNDLTHPDSINE